MKTNLYANAVLALAVLTFSGCQKNDNLVSPSTLSGKDLKVNELESNKKNSDKHNLATIIFNYTGRKEGGHFTGTFTGGPAKAGTVFMDVTVVGMEFHCTNKLVSPSGTMTILSVCQMSDNTGIWYVVSGTNHFKKLQGKGTLIMTFPGSGIIVTEVWTGKFWKGDDNEGEDDELEN